MALMVIHLWFRLHAETQIGMQQPETYSALLVIYKMTF